MAERTCTDCGSDISSRHGNAKRCLDCARKATAEVQRNRPSRDTRRRGISFTSRRCTACDAEFGPSREQQHSCSNRCYMWSRAHPGVLRPSRRECLTCGDGFDVVNAHSQFCGARCRAAASKRRTGRTNRPYVRHAMCHRCDGPMPRLARAGQKFCSEACVLRDKKAERAAMAAIGSRRCSHCDTEFRPTSRRNVTCSPRCSGLAHYYANRDVYIERTLQWFAENPARGRENARAWQERNADYIRARNLAWTRANPDRCAVNGQRRRAAKRNNPGSVGVSHRDWQSALRRAGGRCFYCGVKPEHNLHMEHVIPLSRGGRHAIGNVVPACRSCNLRKHDKLVSEWRIEVMREWLQDVK